MKRTDHSIYSIYYSHSKVAAVATHCFHAFEHKIGPNEKRFCRIFLTLDSQKIELHATITAMYMLLDLKRVKICDETRYGL